MTSTLEVSPRPERVHICDDWYLEALPGITKGQPYRVPYVSLERLPLDKGLGFQVKNLHLPQGWVNAIPEFRDMDRSWYTDPYVPNLSMTPHQTSSLFTKKNGILTMLWRGKEQARVRLHTPQQSVFGIDSKLNGAYEFEGVRELETAEQFLGLTVMFLNVAHDKLGLPRLPHTTETHGAYGPCYTVWDLVLPAEFVDSTESLLTPEERQAFALQASNMAGQFGLVLNKLELDDRGLLRHYLALPEGKDEHEGMWLSTNAESVLARGTYYRNLPFQSRWESLANLAIGACYINVLLDKKEKQSEAAPATGSELA